MFERKNGFFVTYDSKKYLNCLNYNEKGHLFEALYEYTQYKKKISLSKSVEIVFKIFKDIIDKNSNSFIIGDKENIINNKRKSILTPNQLEEFEKFFYLKYPRKEDRIRAEYAWKKLYPMNDKKLLEKISSGIDNCYKYDYNWQTLNKRYIKLPATWLNVHGWENEYDNIHEKQYTKNNDGNIF